MPAYILVNLTVRDPSFMDEYIAKVDPILQSYGGKRLVAGGQAEVLEGDVTLPSGIAVIEFPSMKRAKTFYADPEYAPLLKLRQSGSDAEIVLVEGL